MRQKQKEKRKSGFRRVMEGLGAFLGLLLQLHRNFPGNGGPVVVGHSFDPDDRFRRNES